MNIRWLLSIGGVAVFMAVLTIPALTRTLERPQESGGDYTQYQEPDQKALFRIYMAANGEVLLDSPAAVWEYFTLFHAPPRSTGATPGRPAPLTPECAQLFTLQRNEITARKLLDQARADFAADLKAAGTWPRTEIMRVSANVSLGTYNAAKGAFPLMGVGGQWFGQAGGTPYAPQRGQSISTYYGAPDTKWCRVRLPPGTIDEGGAKPPLPTSFQIEVEGPALTALPMESGAAEAYLEGQTGRGRNARTIRVDALLEVGPATLNPGRRPGPLSVPARIIAARAMDPVSGRVIHEFIPVKGQAAGRPAATTAAAPPAGRRPASPPERPAAAARAAAPTASPRTAAAPERSTAPTAPQGSKGDYARHPEPDHVALFKLLMAANGEALTRLDQLTWEYVTLLQGPPSGTPECAALVKGMANEITVARRLDEGRKQFAQALHAAQAWPKTQTFRIETFASLSQYDAGKEAFAVSQVSPIVARGAWMAIAYSKGALPQAYPGPVADRCRVQFPAGLKPGSTMPASFALAFEGNEVLGVLPMPSSEAQAYLDSRTGREAGSRRVRIEALVEVGPAVLPPNAHMVAMLKVPAKIVAARAVDPQSGAVLHVWR